MDVRPIQTRRNKLFTRTNPRIHRKPIPINHDEPTKTNPEGIDLGWVGGFHICHPSLAGFLLIGSTSNPPAYLNLETKISDEP